MANKQRFLFTLAISVDRGEAALKLTLLLSAVEEYLPGTENHSLPPITAPPGYPVIRLGDTGGVGGWVWRAGAQRVSFF